MEKAPADTEERHFCGVHFTKFSLKLDHKKRKHDMKKRKFKYNTCNTQVWRNMDKEVLEEFKWMDIDILILSETKKELEQNV